MAGGEMAPAYVISIGYPNPNGSYIGERNTDLSHVRAPYVPGGPEYGGGGTAFEAFLISELKPALEARLPLDPDKAVLFGHSLGGLFAATVLANNPEAFAGYVIASAPLDRDRDIVNKVRAAGQRGAGRRVYVSYTPEDVEVFEAGALGPALAEAGSTFEVRNRFFEDEKHRSSFLRVPQDAFPYLLPPPTREPPAPRPQPVELEPAALARFVGTFQLSPAISMVVRMADGALHARSTDEPEFELVPMSDREFFYRDPGVEARIRFAMNADGAVDGLVIVQGTRKIRGTRIPTSEPR
jgi:pimeloyl-ACP methyl ester carboxylesterase